MAKNELKKFVVENGLYQRYASARKRTYLIGIGETIEGETLNDFECFLSAKYGCQWFDIVSECERIGNSSRQRFKRLRERVSALISKGDCLFLTMTFNDNVLSNTDKKGREKLVYQFLKGFGCDFIANIDFGGLNGREHYHAVIQCSTIDYTLWHCFGAVKGEKVRLRGNNGYKIAKYIDKLALHALKDTTYRNRMLYSRCV